jgi:hypothetical protein
MKANVSKQHTSFLLNSLVHVNAIMTEDYTLLRSDSALSRRSSPKLRRNSLSPYSRSESKLSKDRARSTPAVLAALKMETLHA